MDLTPVLRIFRMVAAEFKGVDDGAVGEWIELTAPLVSRRRFGNLYHQALALLTAHRMKVSGVNAAGEEDALGDVGAIGVGNLMRVANYSEGEVSIGFNSNMAQFTATDAELALTPYGIQYLSLRRMKIMPIISAGESHG
jgi:hypothetical protein